MIDSNSPSINLKFKTDEYAAMEVKDIVNGFINNSLFENQEEIQENVTNDIIIMRPKIGVFSHVININTTTKIYEINAHGECEIKITFTDDKIKISKDDLNDLSDIISDHFENYISPNVDRT
jgi:DNA-directed RNA polymerase subunit F